MDSKIIKFIKARHILTLATTGEFAPHTANMFYAFDKENYRLYFTSPYTTLHIQQGIANPKVGINIVYETKIVGKIQGLQAVGTLRSLDNKEELSNARKLYIKRFPYTAVMDLHLWMVDIDALKYTDNTLGFGKKLHWNREQK